MKNIRQTLIDEFTTEIKIGKTLSSNFFYSNSDLVQNINQVSTIIENNEKFKDSFPIDEKRKIFNNGFPTSSLKMLWFTAIKEDNLELYLFTIEGLKWKKGNEILSAINCQKDYLENFKPTKIIDWLVNGNHESKEETTVVRNLSSCLLYIFENSEVKVQNDIISSDKFITNNEQIYHFLKQTKNDYLFDIIMEKQLKNFGISDENIILTKSNRYSNLKLYEWFFNHIKKEDIDNLKNIKLDNLAAFLLQKTLLIDLQNKELKSKTIKI